MGIECHSDACHAVLSYVVPSLGGVTGLLLFIGPLPAVFAAVKSKQIGSLNALPFALITANCLGWILYGSLIKDYFVFTPNLIGWSIGSTAAVLLFPLTDEKTQRNTLLALVGLSTVVFIMAGIAFISLSFDTGKLVVGFAANIALVFFYASPLTTFATVIRSKDSLINGGLWGVYGLVSTDFFIAVPNIIGAFLAIFQLVLLALFPRGKGLGAGDDVLAQKARQQSSGALAGPVSANSSSELLTAV
ncbi:hypothetical protein DFJ73DRAFT_858157 [Zopfochytrium polystomum]|nr:hypothetical protein DFJ73DRAFT_858157 [Zopfochytrium polystomum]